eukprot:gene14959-6113_t
MEYEELDKPSARWDCIRCLFPNMFTDQNIRKTINDTRNEAGGPKYMFPKLRHGLKIAHLNINRLYNKLDSVKELLQHTSLDVLGLTETWLTSDIDDDELEIECYSIFLEDRGTKGKSEGGGVITYMKSCLKVTPELCPYKFIEALSNSFTNLDTAKKKFVIIGDFNIDFSSKKGSKLQRSFKSFLLSHDLHQIIEKATRVTEYSETLIDFICVNNKHRVVQLEVNDTHLSDHSIVVCVLKGGVPKTPFRIIEYRSYKKFNKEQFERNDLKEMPWNEIYSIGCIDEAATHWESLFNRVADKHGPIKKQRVKGFRTPWVTNEVLQLRHEKTTINRRDEKLGPFIIGKCTEACAIT